MSLPPLFRPNFKDDINSPDDTKETSGAEEHKSDHSAHSKDSEGDIELDLNDISDDEGSEGSEDDGHHSDAGGAHDASQPFSRYMLDILMKTFVYGMIGVTWYLIVFYFNMPLKEGFMGAQGSEVIITVLSFMAATSYFKCSSNSSANQKQRAPPFIPNDYQSSCKPCQKWKPERTHHCRWCRGCILRMDHHCPWICNCVGYRNHKAFLLFCFYIGIGSLYFNYRGIKYFFWTPTPQQSLQLDYSISWIIFIVFCGVTICPVGLMAFGLSIYHFCLAMSNLTTLEHYKGGTICSFSRVKKMNKYDNGKLVNLADFFGNTYLWWWWPTIASSYKGQRYVRLNEASQREIDNFVESQKDKAAIAEDLKNKPKSLKEINMEELFRTAEESLKGKELKFNELKLENPKE